MPKKYSSYHCSRHRGFARWCRDCVYYSKTLRAADRLQRERPTLSRAEVLEIVQLGLPSWRVIKEGDE